MFQCQSTNLYRYGFARSKMVKLFFVFFFLLLYFFLYLLCKYQHKDLRESATDDILIRVETCTDPCGPNPSDEAASTAADDDLIGI